MSFIVARHLEIVQVAFLSNGKIKMILINASGSFFSSTVARYGICDHIEGICDRTGEKVVVSLEFKAADKPCTIKSN